VVPDTAELARTVERMEPRLRARGDPRTAQLLQAYHRVVQRFREDLTDPRDLLRSQGAALMLIQELVRSGGEPEAGG
jgi:hypothetical protein